MAGELFREYQAKCLAEQAAKKKEEEARSKLPPAPLYVSPNYRKRSSKEVRIGVRGGSRGKLKPFTR